MEFHYRTLYIVRTEDVYGNGSFEGVFLNRENAEKFLQYAKENWKSPWIEIEEYDVPTDCVEEDMNGTENNA